jgi:prepilin-type N-terminal cleavage/methylation domain-containing protein
MRKRSRSSRGFTLIELLVVLVISSVLASITGASIAGQIQQQNLSLAQQDVAQMIRNARQLAISKSRLFTVEFRVAPQNQIRLYEGDDWDTAILKQEQTLPDNINMQTAGSAITTFNFRGETPPPLRTVYLVMNTDSTSYTNSAACDTAQGCKAVVISTVLGKIRTVK